MTKQFTVRCGFASYHCATVSVEANSIEEACRAAIEQADAGERWQSSDHIGDAFVAAVAEGADAMPRSGPVSTLPVPARFTEQGEPPVVTLTGPRPPGGVEVTGGAVRIRFVDDAATITTEVSDPPPPPGSKPVVTIRPRPDRAPEVEVARGKAIVRIEGWEGGDHAQA